MKEKLNELARLSEETSGGYFTIGFLKGPKAWKIHFCNLKKFFTDPDLEKALVEAITWVKGKRSKSSQNTHTLH